MSALMASMRISTRSRRLEKTTVPPVTLTCSIETGIRGRPEEARLDGGLVSPMRSRCSGTFSTGRTITSSVTSGRPDHSARQRHIGLDAADGEAVVDVAVLRLLQRDVAQGDVERRPKTDPGAAVDGELVAGLALDPLLDRRGQEAGGNADHQQQRQDDDHGGDGGPGDFQCSHVDIPDRASSRIRRRRSARPIRRAYPGNGKALKAAKNNPRLLQSYVTYDTLPQAEFATAFSGGGIDLEGNAMSKQAEFAVILKMNPMFADLGTDELQRISSLCHTQQLGVGEMLFQKGDAGDALFGVRRGQIRIETGASDGSRLTLNFMGPGDLFGEVAVLDGQSRTADAPQARRPNYSCCGGRIFSRISNASRRSRSRSSSCCASASAGRASGWRNPCCSRCRCGWRAGSARWRPISAPRSTSRRSNSASSSAPRAKASTVSSRLWRKDGILDLQRGRILLQNLTKLTAVARNE